jgi:hypothetical protein
MSILLSICALAFVSSYRWPGLPADIICSDKNVESNCSAIFSWHYISLRYDILYISKLSVIHSWERYVYCLFCNSMATLKPTKTGRIMLRCNTRSALIFANGMLSQQRIQMLKDYVFTTLR